MFRTIEDFIQEWQYEGPMTQKIMDALTDESLNQQVAQDHRTLGQLAWHIVTTLHEMMSRTGLEFEAPEHESKAPATAKEMTDGYRQASSAMIAALQEQWTDETLKEVKDMYGDQWPNGVTLSVLVKHQVHHRGQMTILMRQAGLRVPGVYGPSREEWQEFGMEPPAQ
ncbi:DinB family protein [Bacillus sp. FJAT-27445]|uniref:DinB family protein n=1 Tax=Bacillus sp. FJAT-27445 TaxID=1679166 RepID=UPI0007443DE6|nr:DinB family protein [Bacillus sp. FJAT-27445]